MDHRIQEIHGSAIIDEIIIDSQWENRQVLAFPFFTHEKLLSYVDKHFLISLWTWMHHEDLAAGRDYVHVPSNSRTVLTSLLGRTSTGHLGHCFKQTFFFSGQLLICEHLQNGYDDFPLEEKSNSSQTFFSDKSNFHCSRNIVKFSHS